MFIIQKLIASYQSQIQKTKAAPYLLFVPLVLIFYFPAIAVISADSVPLKEITVVSDDHYPPFIFRDEKGHLQGILVDEWRLWEEKTGIKVDLRGMDWDKAQKTMAEGNAQVIDTIFFTEERAKTLAFSAPYASIDVPIFFHRDISGIKDVKSLDGFTVGVKAGDACIDFFKRNGIRTLREYPSYESIARDAAAQKINVFCIDSPPAHYYLYKMNIEQQYRHTAPLYTGQFHRAVHKERKDLLTAVEEGFAKISRKEHEEIEKRWRGSSIALPYLTYLFYLVGVLVILGGILLLWNYTLRRKVTQKTVQLQEAIDTLEKSEELFRSYLEYAPDGIYMSDLESNFLYGNRKYEEILGYRREELVGKNFLELDILPETSLNKAVQLLQANIEGKSTGPDEIELISKEGRLIPVEINTSVLHRMGQRIVLAFVRDITERKRTEQELRESEERFRTLSDKTPLGMCLIDIDGRYEYVNPAFVKIFGYDLSDIPTGKEWFRTAYPDPEYRREVIANWKEDLSSYTKLEIRPRIYEVRCKGGAFRTIMFRPVTLPTDKQLIIYEDITERKQAEKQLQDTLESLRKAVGATMQVMVAAVETRDPYTSGHQKRSADLARAIAAEMGLPPEKIEGIRMAGSIHDIGKLSIPAEILSKPTKLSEIEFSLIKEHAKKGYEMLKDVESPWPLAEIVRQHHERMDGSGYPRNLKGDDILIEARILSVADVVEAMASHRPYRPSLGVDAALNEIEKNRGIFYDNAVADACLRLFREKGFKLEGLDYKR
ncbi:MAG: PAS domain S-box protein [Syntrophales bacterium]|nr:PAS domain S-box protein [Syntrophales bacterium]